MDHVSILGEIREEILEIISNYHRQLQELTKYGTSRDNGANELFSEEKTTLEYAIFIYGTALQMTDFLIKDRARQ